MVQASPPARREIHRGVNRLLCGPEGCSMKRITLLVSLMFLAVAPLVADCSMSDKKMLEAYDRAWGDAATSGGYPRGRRQIG